MNLNKLILTSLAAITTATAAFAAGENVIASKKYTDDTFQTKIPAEVSTLSDMTGDAGVLIGATDANGVVSQRLIIPGYKRASGNGELGFAMYDQSNYYNKLWGSWDYATEEFTATLDDIYRSFSPNYNGMGYDPKYSVPSMELALDWVNDTNKRVDHINEIKQDKIEWDESSTPDPEITLLGPSSSEEPGELVQHAIWAGVGNPLKRNAQATPDQYTLFGGNITQWSDSRDGDLFLSVPSVYALGQVASSKQNNIGSTSATYTYDQQNRPTANGSLVETTGTAGTITQRGIATAPTYDANNQLSNGSWIPTMGAMMTALTTRVPTGTANTLANYDANGALSTGIAMYNGLTTYNSTTDSAKIPTMAVVQRKKVCAGWPSDVAVADRSDANCWLWELPD